MEGPNQGLFPTTSTPHPASCYSTSRLAPVRIVFVAVVTITCQVVPPSLYLLRPCSFSRFSLEPPSATAPSPIAPAECCLASLPHALTHETICSHNNAVRWVVFPDVFADGKNKATASFSEVLKFIQHSQVWGLSLCNGLNICSPYPKCVC